QEATTAYADGTALADGYAQVSDTVASKTLILSNILKSMIEGVTNSGPLSLLLDVMISLGNAFENIARSPVGKVVGTIVTILLALTGVLAALAGAGALVVASIFALTTSMKFMNDQVVSGIGPVSLLKEQLAI